MKHYLVQSSSLKGKIQIPSSKSHTLRAILFGSLGKNKTIVRSYLDSTDTQAMIQACRLFGADITVFEDRLEIQGIGGEVQGTEDVIDAGNSGIVLRFCTAIGALAKRPVVITGDHSIRHHREMLPLLNALNQLGADAKSMRGDGYAPVIIQGPIGPGNITISGHDSQPVSALLIAASLAKGPIDIHVENPGEKPWIGVTLEWLDRLGIAYENKDYERYQIPGNARFEGFDYSVPGDFSTAAFPIAAALVTNSELLVHNLDMRDAQGDKELISVFQQMGANIDIDEKERTVHVQKGKELTGLDVDINNFIDAIPILAVVSCFSEGKMQIRNASVARNKECNRIQCITRELQKMGADITETEDGLIVKRSSLKGAHLHSYHDHRMAMALTVAAMGAKNPSKIAHVECVAKTFPTFKTQFHSIGANIEEV